MSGNSSLAARIQDVLIEVDYINHPSHVVASQLVAALANHGLDPEVALEFQRQDRAYPHPKPREKWIGYMIQELGEVSRANSREVGDRLKPVEMSSREELVQLAAVCLRALRDWDSTRTVEAPEPRSGWTERSTRRVYGAVVHEMADFGTDTLCDLDLREPWEWTEVPVNCPQCLSRMRDQLASDTEG